jgi:hypothetical protein
MCDATAPRDKGSRGGQWSPSGASRSSLSVDLEGAAKLEKRCRCQPLPRLQAHRAQALTRFLCTIRAQLAGDLTSRPDEEFGSRAEHSIPQCHDDN